MILAGDLATEVEARYQGWNDELGGAILEGRRTLAELAALVEEQRLDPKPVSGGQERLENLVRRHR
jgi:xylose isomerase